MYKTLKTLILIFITPMLLYGNVNQDFIEKEIIKIKKDLYKSEFVKGTVYFSHDSIETELLIFKKRDRANKYLFCISKTANDSLIFYTATDIIGYRINDDHYLTHYSNDECFFIRIIGTGRIDLYERTGIPSDNRFLYYIKLPDNKDLFVICPNEKNVTEYRIPDSNSQESGGKTISYYKSSGVHKKFEVFIMTYLGNCKQVKLSVTAGLLTIYDISDIVEIYNNCF